MAKDDMLLPAYKILRYLYGCNRRGKTPTFSDLYRTLELPGVPVSYLARIYFRLRRHSHEGGDDHHSLGKRRGHYGRRGVLKRKRAHAAGGAGCGAGV